MKEKRVLYISVLFALFFALFGIVYGIAIKSTMVIFDGIYSTISIILSLLSVVVLKQIKHGNENEQFPFGKWHFEPTLMVFKSFVIVSLCVYSLSNAVSDLMSGGNDVEVGMALLYSIISLSLCTFVFLFIRAKNKTIKSDLLEAEATQWMGDSLLSLGVMIGFGIALLLFGTRFEKFVPYADPMMVIVASSLFLFFPLKTLLKGFKELIFYKAHDSINSAIKKNVATIANDMNAEYKMHLVKIGRELFLEVNFLTRDQAFSVKEMDKIRDKIESEIEGEVWLNMNITSNKKWL